MKYIFASIFAAEMDRYLNLLHESGRYICRIQSSLRSLDKYLTGSGLTCKTLDAETVSKWIKTRDVSSSTKASDICNVKGFFKFLISLGFDAEHPETPKVQSSYVPYIFSDDEMGRIISVADNFEAGKKLTRSALVFPILLRILYGCGLRLSEGRSLRWSDVDLKSGVITIRKAKNKKQRFCSNGQVHDRPVKKLQGDAVRRRHLRRLSFRE